MYKYQKYYGTIGTLARMGFNDTRAGKTLGSISRTTHKIIHPLDAAKGIAINKTMKSMFIPKGTSQPGGIKDMAKGIGQFAYRNKTLIGAGIGAKIQQHRAGKQAYNRAIASGATPQQAEQDKKSAARKGLVQGAVGGAIVGNVGGRALNNLSGGKIKNIAKYGTGFNNASGALTNGSNNKLVNQNSKNLAARMKNANTIADKTKIRKGALHGLTTGLNKVTNTKNNNARNISNLKSKAAQMRSDGNIKDADNLTKQANKLSKDNINLEKNVNKARTKVRTATGMNQKYMQMWRKQGLSPQQIQNNIALKKSMGMWSIIYDRENRTFIIN